MHVRDIVRAISIDDRRATEAGFRALVGYPHEEEVGGATPKTLMATLEACCDALVTDTSRMPRETRAACGDECGTYADGAACIQANRETWEHHFQLRCRRAA